MGTLSKWSLSKEEQERFISVLTDELPPLRAKLGISQGEIAYLIGISRQSYSLIECKKRKCRGLCFWPWFCFSTITLLPTR